MATRLRSSKTDRKGFDVTFGACDPNVVRCGVCYVETAAERPSVRERDSLKLTLTDRCRRHQRAPFSIGLQLVQA